MKKRIGLFTNWYPTSDNPYSGVFFKEQAIALKDAFDFSVFHYNERIAKPFAKRLVIDECAVAENTTEYSISASIPLHVYLSDLFATFKGRFSGKNRTGLGQVSSTHRYAYRKKLISECFSKEYTGRLDLLYCIDAQTEAGLVSLVAEELGLPYIAAEHGVFPWPGTTIDSFTKRSIEKADAFFAISNDKIRQVLLQDIHLPKIYYVGNMVDETCFGLRSQSSEGHVCTFIIVAANSYYKNYDLFIKIMDRLTELTDIPFRVLIVGYAANKGYSQDREGFEGKIRRSAFADRAELIPEVPHDRLAECLHRADAFVMTSIQEGQPVSAIEAACCGLPVFSTRCGGVEDYIDDSMGRIFPVTEVEGFADTLHRFIKGEISFDRKYIRDSVVQRFGKDAFVKNMTDAFDEVIKHAGT